MASAVAKIPKPQLRGLLRAQTKRNIAIAMVLSAIGGFAVKTFLGDARKKQYADFYKNYDAKKEFEQMRAKGVFQSC
ncbi:hypothetical protein O3M35_005802 [Rhynocoris fuscipes]|uniref:Mitochondrial cytochrome c oxidase subunit VIc/VIIs domain-containing protein n=1 Tax=Rhynocoris fuscipes TaxID=488301 RepID=A0AAW1DNA7_9HEMI